MNQKNLSIVLILAVITLVLSGCQVAKEAEAALTPPAQSTTAPITQTTSENNHVADDVEDALVSRAKKEGVTVEEMQQMVEQLAKLTAEKYGSTLADYQSELADQGKTAFQEFAQAADMLGITFKEYLDYEIASIDNMSDEQKGTLAAMAAAVESVDLSKLESQASQAASNFSGGGDRLVEGGYKELGLFEIDNIVEEKDDFEAEGVYEITYESSADTKDIINHFVEKFEGTPDYSYMSSPDQSETMITCQVNDGDIISLIIIREGSDTTKINYGYMDM